MNERESVTAWVVDPDRLTVDRHVAYFCDNPADPDREHPYWWVPGIGYSIPEDRLHIDREAAEEELGRLIAQRRAVLDAAAATLSSSPKEKS